VETDFRQLRHQTKNALQRMLLVIEEHSAVRDSEAGQAVATELQRRITLMAAISDALFGLTHAPGPFVERLGSLCENVVALLGGPDQDIRVGVFVAGRCPPALHETVLRVAHELVGNAVKHGMYARIAGRIEVRLESDDCKVRLVVTDDGWGWVGQPAAGEGLSLARLIAVRAHGTMTLSRRGDRTMAMLALPYLGDTVTD
jgi:two-component sensor histidine kinase